jgi:predicted phosphodiesterase
MRYALISDIHSNKFAFESILDDIDRQNIDMILCLGDIVGYGPNPTEVLDLVYEHVDATIIGNHDAVICNKFSSAYFNNEAKSIIEWTKTKLRTKDVNFFDKLTYIIDAETFKCSHSNFTHPESFAYILSKVDARNHFSTINDKIVFVGHTHYSGAFILNKNSTITHLNIEEDYDLRKINIENSKRYIINVGSVGVSRTYDFAARYCIYDSDQKNVEIRAVEYDVKAFIKELKATDNKEIRTYFMPYIMRF